MKRLFALCIGALVISCSSPKSEQEKFSEQVREEAAAPIASAEPEISSLEASLIDQGLVDIQAVVPAIKVDLKYSTEDNFFGQDVYGELTKAYLQAEVAEMVKAAQQALVEEFPNYTLLIYDGVRPASVQQILWDNLDKPDSLKPLYVADPKVGSLHNFGVAVDLTIYDLEEEKEVDMGTGFDFFGYAAYPVREDQMISEGVITKTHVAHREILRGVMTKAGFTGITSEWWHFNAYSRKVAGEKFEIIQ